LSFRCCLAELSFSALSQQRSSRWTREKQSSKESIVSSNYQSFSIDAAAVSSCPAFLKLLVSDNIAGRIIGKSGESILKLQKQCRCRIKLSQTREFFPGTSDRVCLMQGDNYDNLKLAVGLILKRCREVGVS